MSYPIKPIIDVMGPTRVQVDLGPKAKMPVTRSRGVDPKGRYCRRFFGRTLPLLGYVWGFSECPVRLVVWASAFFGRVVGVISTEVGCEKFR